MPTKHQLRMREYERLVSEAGLYCYAFFGYTADKVQRRTLNALWELAGATVGM